MLILLWATLSAQAASTAELKGLREGVKLQSGSVVMLQQHAAREKYSNDMFVTLHCPHPYKSCSMIDVKQGGGRIPPAPKK